MTTIKEIAERAGTSYSTVSRALNDKKGVSAEFRRQILDLAEEMNYFPHSSARALVRNRVGVLGVVITRTGEFAFQNPFYTHMLMGLSATINSSDYRLLLTLNGQGSYAALFQRRLVDGLIIVGNRTDDPNLSDLVKNHIPAVVVPGLPKDSVLDIPSVTAENYDIFRRAMKYLIDLGHHRIAFITGKMNSLFTIDRVIAYGEVLREHGIAVRPEYLRESDFSKTDGFTFMGHLLDLPEPPTAVVCMNDLITPGALHQIYQRGLTVPGDISVLAIGCSENFELYHPPITVIRTRVTEVGKIASRMLIQQIEDGVCERRHVAVDSELVIRESTGVPA